MKFLVILATTLAVARTQRPTYAGLTPKGYPELASRFRDPADDQDNPNSTDVVNRFGGTDEAAQNIPVDARGDVNLVNRLNQWPRENRPFWLINAEQIEKHRRPSETANRQNLEAELLANQKRLNELQLANQQRLDELQLANQQRLNELQSNLDSRNQPMIGGANQQSQVAQARPVVIGGANQQSQVAQARPVVIGGANQQSQVAQARPVVSRLGQSVGLESRTIKPQSQRGSFSGQRS